MAGHKQSGDINNPSNFDNHKVASTDVSAKPLNRCGQSVIEPFYNKFHQFLSDTKTDYDPALWAKYVSPYVQERLEA
jgi:hypothetical protein